MAIAEKMIILAALFVGVIVGWALTLVTVFHARGKSLREVHEESYQAGYVCGALETKRMMEEKKDGGTETE